MVKIEVLENRFKQKTSGRIELLKHRVSVERGLLLCLTCLKNNNISHYRKLQVFT